MRSTMMFRAAMMLTVVMMMTLGAQTALAQSYTLGGNYVKFQKFVQLNPEQAAQYVVTTEAEEGEEVTASIDDTKIPQGKYFTGVFTSDDVTVTTDWEFKFTMPAKNVTVNAVLANQEDYTIDLTSSTTAVISEEISTLLSYMEVGGKNCSVYDDKYNWFLDLNVDGINDLEVKSTFDATTEKNIFSIEQLSGSGVYKTSCSFALNVTPLDRYKSLTFKFKEAVPVRTLQANWITLSGDLTYTGQPIEPTVTVMDGSTPVAVTVDYSNNTNAGEATVTVTAIAEGYTGSVSKKFTISPKPVTISRVKAKDKVYDGTTAAEIDAGSATIGGKVEGDELTVNAESVTAAFADANAGGGKAVILSGNFTLAGTSAGNYTLSVQPDIAAGTIEQKEVTVSGLTAEEKNYDPHNNVATINCRGAVFNGLIEGDELTISDVTGTYIIGENVDATLDVTLDYTNATLGGKSAANYKLATEDNQATTIITIHKVSQTVTITFDPNGGTGEMDPMSAQKGETVRLTDNTFYRQGYSFKNWNTKADGSGDKYEDKQSIKIDEDLTLYAQWKEKNIIETNIETKKNLDGSTTTIVTSKETDSSGKLVKESNTSTTNFLDGSKKVSESKTPETDGKRVYVSEDGTLTGIDLGNSMLFGGVSRDNIVGIIQNSTQGSGGSDAQPDILIAQGNESNVLVNKETEIDPQGEVTATSASLTVKQTGDTEGATGKSKPTQIAINAGGDSSSGDPVSAETVTVTFINGVTVLEIIEIEKGTVPEYKGETPTKAEDEMHTYEFAGWDPKIEEVYENTTYYAVFTETLRQYTIKFISEGEVFLTETYAYAEVIEAPSPNPTKAEDDKFTYTFKEWKPSIVTVTGDATYTAVFEATPKTGGDDGGGEGGSENPDAPTSGTFGNLTWEVSKSDANSTVYDVLTISGSGKMNNGSPWKAYQNQIKTVIFESVINERGVMEGVTSIGNEAFSGCSSLTSVTIPAGVTSIGDMAFFGCSSLKSVTIPAGVTSIGKSAFSYCSAMTSLTFAEGSQLQTISYSAFYGLTSLTSNIILPASVTSIGISAFSSVSNNTTDGNHVYITVPDGKKLKVMIAGVTDPVEITPTNGKADIIGCLFDDPSMRIASRALTLEIVEASTGDEEPSTRDKNDRAATTMTVNYETKKETGEDGRSKSKITFEFVPKSHQNWDLSSLTRGASAEEEEEDDEIEIVSGREYEILHDGYVVLNFYTPDAPITVNSIIIRRPGDANNDGYVDAADLVEMINAKNGKASERFNLANADIDRDGEITQDDIDAVVKLIMEPKDKGDE